MKVKITRACFAGGKPVDKNKVVDLEDREAKFLVAIRKAEVPKPKAPTAPKD